MKLKQNNAPYFLFSCSFSFFKELLEYMNFSYDVEYTFCEVFTNFVVLKVKL